MENIAQKIIDKCGGVRRTAELCECTESWVYKWTYPKGRNGGRGGLVPHEDAEKLLQAARRGDVDLSPEDFFKSPKP